MIHSESTFVSMGLLHCFKQFNTQQWPQSGHKVLLHVMEQHLQVDACGNHAPVPDACAQSDCALFHRACGICQGETATGENEGIAKIKDHQ
jgi:hypothetical protein